MNSPSIGRCAGLAVVTGLHAAILWALLQVEAVRSAVNEVAPIFVTFVTPAPEIKPPEPLPIAKPQPQPNPIVKPKPEPKPVKKAKPKAPPPKEPQAVPLVAAEIPAPTPEPIDSAPPAPPPQPAAPSEPTLAELKPAPPPPPLEPPRFDIAYLNNPAPDYPSYSRRLGEEGRVLLRVLVSAEGFPRQVEIKTSSGSRRLDQAALEAVKNWRFIPAKRGEVPIEGWALVPINFQLS